MSRPRGLSEATKTAHSIGLKVLRLSKPSLALQFPLPKQPEDFLDESSLNVDPAAAYSNPATSRHDGSFILSPLLALPPAFGTVHVGETFSCTLCATNELPQDSSHISVNGVRLSAEMQTPSQQQGVPIDLYIGQQLEQDGEPGTGAKLSPGETLQRIVRHELREEGNHVLAVTVSYTETYKSADPTSEEQLSAATSGRQRSFRKVYQFPAHQLLSVRTKARLVPPKHNSTGPESFLLEAQLENLDEKLITLEKITMHPRGGLVSNSLNAWDVLLSNGTTSENPSLAAGAILQAAFRIEDEEGKDVERIVNENHEKRVVLGHLAIEWRSQMGEAGSLTTGWLTWKSK